MAHGPCPSLWQQATSLKNEKKREGKDTKALQYMLGYHGKTQAEEHKRELASSQLCKLWNQIVENEKEPGHTHIHKIHRH